MKNQKGISLIALIITIIVIIILAVVVIAGANNTPEQAQFATFCQDYDTIQSAITTAYATELLNDQTDATNTTKLTTQQLYSKVATGVKPTEAVAANTDIEMAEAGFTLIGVNRPNYSAADSDWTVNSSTGKLKYATGFPYNGAQYVSPSETK